MNRPLPTPASDPSGDAQHGSPQYESLIAVDQLQHLLTSPNPPLLLDVRFDLADTAAGERAYEAGHLPGAFYLHLDRDLSGPKQLPNGPFRGRHPLPEREALAQRLRSLGLRQGQQVVVMDAADGMFAARVWWMLRWLGHAAVAVLDGGLAAWQQAGGPLVTTASTSSEGDFQPSAPLEQPLSAQELHAALGRVRLIDARAAERFRGDVEPLDAQAGHIPGASNRFFKSNLGPDGRFKPPAMLREEFQALLGVFDASGAVHQCGSGVTACHNLLAMHHAGLPGSRLYAGSWSEWSAQPGLPLARG